MKHNLTQNKFFKKVQKKESSSKSYLWEINPEYNIKLQDSSSSLLLSKTGSISVFSAVLDFERAACDEISLQLLQVFFNY